ncbi:serine hydrolase domain-containing protein [Microbacterium sp. A93]|uniref:serine hydrolase domain-containing protein n=1 Tax=unclassified Microbacterium TaxID=2609290 RepID=UPI003F4311F2
MTDTISTISTRPPRYPNAQSAPSQEDWQDAPHNRWAFANVSHFVPTMAIARQPRERERIVRLDALSNVPGLESRLDAAFTDALVVVRHGEVLAEYYRDGFAERDQHLLMSVSKSICGITIASLVDDGLIDPEAHVSTYLPELADSAHGIATVQQVLDMTVAVAYSEDYRDPDSEVRQQDRVAGWRLPRAGDPRDTYAFLQSLRSSGAPGEQFQYCSADTDVLAWIIEAVTGRRYADEVADRLWQRLGCRDEASITVDQGGFAFANGGISCTARDLARVGELMLAGGELGGQRIVSAEWVSRTMAGGDPELARGSAIQRTHPNASYRNQWWSTGNERGNVYAVGIHGQYVWLDPLTDTVIVKLSSCPEPVTEAWNDKHAGLFRDITGN